MAYWERCASSVITRMCGLAFSSGKVSVRSASRNLWIMAMTRSEESERSSSFSFLMLSATLTVKPMLWLVSESWSSSWVRSVTKTTFQLRELGMAIHLAHHEHHGQRFARALGVPDDAAALAGVLALQQALHRQLDGAELLVAPHDLDGLALVVGRKEREGADEVQQIVAVEHPGHQALLIIGAAARRDPDRPRCGDRDRPSGRSISRCGW